ACPNPFLGEFIKHHGKPYDPATDCYQREPFAADVSEGKNDPIYNAHSYHTKVPHKAIMRYILHYTEPGDIVYDGFCGTGMTGVAAQLCGDRAAVESLGLRVDAAGLGARKAVLNDLSPAATFIAYNYNTPVDVKLFEREAKRILREVEAECGWMYSTLGPTETGHATLPQALAGKLAACHTADDIRGLLKSQPFTLGTINYTVWSDVFVCAECTREVVFWEAAVDKTAGKVRDEFPCPHCGALLTKRRMDRAWTTKFDRALNQSVRQTKQVPVLVNYSLGKKRYEKTPDAFDLAVIAKIEQSDIPHWFPTDRMPEGEESRRNDPYGITHVHHFYTKRSVLTLTRAYEAARTAPPNVINYLLFTVQQAVLGLARISRYVPTHFSQVNQYLSGTLYVGSQVVEVSLNYILNGKTHRLAAMLRRWGTPCPTLIETASATTAGLSSSSVDYIFTDPPFGGNLMYSELNFLWEAWLKVFTNNKPEAIENSVQKKGLKEYQDLMTRCFQEYYRVLKPGRWMTVEFHNSQNRVWNAIQESLQHAGFVVADVRTLDKKQGSFKQVTSANAVKQDLVISAYKPNGGLEERFKLVAGTEAGVWDFVRTHMRQLPVAVVKSAGKQSTSSLELIAERQPYLLYDRMVAFHVQRGVMIPLSAAEFYAGLAQRFSERDGMYFLPEQVAEYDKKRILVGGVEQLQVFITGEASAIQWLKQQLGPKPQTFQEIHPQFMQELGGWQKFEQSLELSELLEQSFLRYDGKGEVPSQIHSYLSTNFKDLRNLPKDHEALRAKAKDRWYVPDPNKAGDLEKLREKALLKEFADYVVIAARERRLKVFRSEAVHAGFKKAWQERDYATIIAVARKIPDAILQEDAKLTMWYDQAMTRSGEH
ncbi:MAG: hypothetical protein KGZ66_09505, partial [Selenomonadales bacterium]|nr:hypothetical protein [Selenomonadales bacterium]